MAAEEVGWWFLAEPRIPVVVLVELASSKHDEEPFPKWTWSRLPLVEAAIEVATPSAT